MNIGSKFVSALLSTADKVQVLSSSASDVTPKCILIQGEVGGLLLSETLVLTGTSAVDSTYTYDSGCELTISSGTNDGTLSELSGIVTVREKTTSSNTLAKIAPNQRAPYYRWVRFSPTPNSAITAQVWYKRNWLPLTNDNDVPLIPCSNEIVEGVVADALWEDGQENAAAAQESKFNNSVAELFASRRSRNLISQVVPDNGSDSYPTERVFYNGNSY